MSRAKGALAFTRFGFHMVLSCVGKFAYATPQAAQALITLSFCIPLAKCKPWHLQTVMKQFMKTIYNTLYIP